MWYLYHTPLLFSLLTLLSSRSFPTHHFCLLLSALLILHQPASVLGFFLWVRISCVNLSCWCHFVTEQLSLLVISLSGFVDQSSYTVSTLEGFQHLAGWSPEQPGLMAPLTLPWPGGWAPGVPSHLHYFLILLFGFSCTWKEVSGWIKLSTHMLKSLRPPYWKLYL